MGAEHQPAQSSPTRNAPARASVQAIGAEISPVEAPRGDRFPGDLLARLALDHPTARSVRETTVVDLQQRHGNAHMVRLLDGRSDRSADLRREPHGGEPEAPAGEEKATPAAPTDAPAAQSGAPPAPTPPKALDLATAQGVLTKAYGKIKPIVPGSIVVLPDRNATWAKYDEVAKGRPNPHNNNQPWTDGDAKKYSPNLDGFADQGTEYINQETKFAVVTAHEVLHNNCAAGFKDAVGEWINEGTTEYLALKAMREAGYPSDTGYGKVLPMIGNLANLVGEQTLIDAYFTGADPLIAAFDKLQGPGAFAALKAVVEKKDWDEAARLTRYNPREI